MLELKKDALVFKFPEVHEDAELTIEFQRTFRIPDDGKTYPLPPGFGKFPTKHVDDFKERVPAKWIEHGGVMLPMYQAEAMWLNFSAKSVRYRDGINNYPFAVRVAAGKVNAVNGEEWTKLMREDDHMVVPPQPWLDGFCVEKGKIRQFVAMPLGWGLTVEQQVTGEEEFGGLQIEVCPMRAEEFERRYPKRQPPPPSHGILRSMSLGDTKGGGASYAAMPAAASMDFMEMEMSRGISPDMGLGAGGQMKQEIYDDPYPMDVWHKARRARTFIHLANSFAWEVITGHKPPATPCTAEAYAAKGLPWYDHYVEAMPISEGGKNLKNIKSVLALGFQKGLGIFPNNASVEVPEEKIVKYKGERPKDAVRDGSW
jgi:hypothetical protein